jgi:hypothetical protein
MVPTSVICNIVESAFNKPFSCECAVRPDGLLRLKVVEPAIGRIHLLIDGVSPAGFTAIRDISDLVGDCAPR